MDIKNKIEKAFASQLGEQCDALYSTSDGKIVIRFYEACRHARGVLDNTPPLEDKTIKEWFVDYNEHTGEAEVSFVEHKNWIEISHKDSPK